MPKQEKPTQKKGFVKKITQKARRAYVENRRSDAHHSFRLSRRSELPQLQKLPSAWRLMKRTFAVLWEQKSITATLLTLYIIIAWSVNGMFALTDFADLKGLFLTSEGALSIDGISILFGSFFAAQANVANENPTPLIMLNIISLLFWLAFIWVARYEIAKKITSVREALYTSGTSLVPFLLVLAAIFIQCVPAAYGFSLVRTIAEGTVFVGGLEVALFSLLAFLLVVLSIYFVVSAIMALQVVALPGMYPWRALQTARKLTMGRHFSILRKYIVLIIMLALAWIAFFTPTLLLENAVCGDASCWVGITILPFVYYLLLGFMLALSATYLYVIYRALLDLQEK